MGFFEQQDRARRATTRLILFYALAVLAIVLAVNLVVVPICSLWFDARPHWPVVAIVSAVTLGVIALGSLEIVARLSLGDAELATLLAGRRAARGIDAEHELLNIVDEMAIASGLAAPPVYVLTREPGINAFAAGGSANHAIVVVTKGAVEHLTRDEMQAVVAHEFAHIINGDVRMNLRTACVLQGIVFLAALGRFMMEYYSGYGTEEGRRFVHLPLALIGAGVFAAGSIGLPFARIIQTRVSREREFLADACAVQYTRNPDALCSALARIRLHPPGARILDWRAEALAHMLFVAASHPDSEERMRRINPHAAPGHYYEALRRPIPPKIVQPAARRSTTVVALLASIGEPNADTLEYAAGLLAYLPAPIREALAKAQGAQSVVLACALAADWVAREPQMRALETRVSAELAREAEVLAPLVAELDRAYRLPLVALALPVLRKDLDARGRESFLSALHAVIEADARVTLAEFVLATIVGSLLERPPAVSPAHACADLRAQCGQVLSLLAQVSEPTEAPPLAFAKGLQALAIALEFTPAKRLGVKSLSAALSRLRGLAPAEKYRFVGACTAAVFADGEVRLAEQEALRALCTALECPMPPAIGALDPRSLRK